ncbi:MAG: ABC transporter ATP-binding protein [Betaproteobacteria bacterium]|nr:MAG: ABC transporter ATP-binding protein [Betaproteobacteria bacterium]
MKAASIEFEHVSKLYGEVAAVRDISFVIAPGTLVTLLGPSGCGKTTTLRMIAGLELPSRGTIRIGGADVTRVPASERDVSMVFQSYALFPHMTVQENVSYGLTVSGLPKSQVLERTRTALATVGLTGFDARLPSELSGGQQQRVAVARALILEPGVLLFDEPLSNLDARLRRQMREEIRELQQRLSLTVVYVTHDQAEAMAVSDRIIIMNKGGVAQEGAARELYEQPKDVFVAGFMGEANRVRGTLRYLDASLGELTLGPLRLTLPHRGLPEGAIDVAIRPESISIGENGAGLPGTLRKVAYLGGLMEYTIDTALGLLFVIDMAVDRPRSVGSAVGLRLADHGVVPIAAGDAGA